MNPNDMSMKLAEQVRLMGAFNELLHKAKDRLPSDLSIGGKRFDRLCKRGVSILRALRKQDPSCFDSLYIVNGDTAVWAFLYAQSGASISECARVLKTQVQEATRGAQRIPTQGLKFLCPCRLCREVRDSKDSRQVILEGIV